MHWLFWVFMGVVLGTSYRLGYKLVSDKFSPLFNVATITFIASLICFALYLWKENSKFALSDIDIKSLWPLLIVGIIVAGLEISIMMIYKSGGPLSIAQTLTSSLVGVFVFAIGLIFFKEELNTGQTVGFILALSGISLMTYYSR